MPVVHPAELWRETAATTRSAPRWSASRTAAGRDMVLAMTHEEVVADLAARHRPSYRQLPAIVYHFQTKFRDEPRARGGLIRVREFVMKDSYTLDRDEAGLDVSYQAHYGAYRGSSSGWGSRRRRRLRRRDDGRQPRPTSSWSSTRRRGHAGALRGVRLRREPADRAASRKPDPSAEEPRPTEEVATPGHDDDRGPGGVPRVVPGRGPRRRRSSWPATAGFVDRHRARRLRGQRDEAGQRASRRSAGCGPRTVEEITARGMEPGYGSPIGAARHRRRGRRPRGRAPRTWSPGANQPGYHLRNVNVGARLHARPRGRHRQRPRGRPMPELRRAGASCARGSRSATSSSSARSTPRRSAPRYLGEDGERHPDRDGLLRHRARAATSPASSRRTTTTRASSGRREVAPYAAHLVALSASQGARRSARSPSGSTTWRQPPVRATRSCTTTATSRPA